MLTSLRPALRVALSIRQPDLPRIIPSKGKTMHGKNILFGVILFSVVACPCAAQPYAKTDRTLLFDHFDEGFVPDGTRCTRPEAMKPVGDRATCMALRGSSFFGPIDVKPEELRLFSGSHVGYSNVESEFALDELRILGPGGDQASDYPTMTIPRIKPPVIDGKIAAGEWDGAAQTTGFVGLNDPSLVDDSDHRPRRLGRRGPVPLLRVF